jgi:peptide/nickel transport system permease protein
MKLFAERKATVTAGAVLIGMALMAAAAPVLTPYLPDGIDLAGRRAAPSFGHLFGTDELGRDVFTRTLYGARISLVIGLLAAGVTAAIGVTIGAVAGYVGGWIDNILMRLTDTMLSVPRLPLLMIAAAIMEPSVPTLILLIGVVGWMETARVIRAEFLSLKQRTYVEAARATGMLPARIMVRHLLPAAAPAAVVAATLAVGRAILLESAMSFFGVGVQPPQPSLGNMLYQAQTSMATEPWLAFFPGIFIFLTVLTVFMVGSELGASKCTHFVIGHSLLDIQTSFAKLQSAALAAHGR